MADLGRRGCRAHDHLDDPAAVAQVDEKQPAVVPEGIHPAGQQHLAAGIIRGQLSAEDAFTEEHDRCAQCRPVSCRGC